MRNLICILESFGTFLTRTFNIALWHCGLMHISLHRVGTGGWSSEGTQLISNITRDNVSTVVFTSIHLTSFAVLVDVAGGHEVC